MAIAPGTCGPLEAIATYAKGTAQPKFPDSNPKWKRTWGAALAALSDNTKLLEPCDPTFVRPIPPNSWGGAAQALTALRAPRWMEHYGKHKELVQLMRQWAVAINASGNPTGKMYEQMDPVTGQFTAIARTDIHRRLSCTWILCGDRMESFRALHSQRARVNMYQRSRHA